MAHRDPPVRIAFAALLLLAAGMAHAAHANGPAETPRGAPAESPTAEPAEAPPAGRIVAQVLAGRVDSGWRIRANVTRRDGTGGEHTVHLMAKGRRDEDLSRTLVVGMWPKSVRGEALMIERNAQGDLSGFHFTPPDSVEALQAEDVAAPLFGMPLTAEDLRASFLRWPDQQVVGRDRVLFRDCWVLESRREQDGAGDLVRSCIAVREHVPLRVERFDATGRLTTSVEVDDLTRRDEGSWAPTAFTITSPGSGERTHVRFSRGDSGMDYPPEDFTVAGVKALIGLD